MTDSNSSAKSSSSSAKKAMTKKPSKTTAKSSVAKRAKDTAIKDSLANASTAKDVSSKAASEKVSTAKDSVAIGANAKASGAKAKAASVKAKASKSATAVAKDDAATSKPNARSKAIAADESAAKAKTESSAKTASRADSAAKAKTAASSAASAAKDVVGEVASSSKGRSAKRSSTSKKANESSSNKGHAAAGKVDDNEALLEALGNALADSSTTKNASPSDENGSSKEASDSKSSSSQAASTDEQSSSTNLISQVLASKSQAVFNAIAQAFAPESESESQVANDNSKSSASEKNANSSVKDSNSTVSAQNGVDRDTTSTVVSDTSVIGAGASGTDEDRTVGAAVDEVIDSKDTQGAVSVATSVEVDFGDGSVVEDVDAGAAIGIDEADSTNGGAAGTVSAAGTSEGDAHGAERDGEADRAGGSGRDGGADHDGEAAAIGVEEQADGESTRLEADAGVAVETSAFYLNRSGIGLVNAFPGTGQKSSQPTSDTSKSEIPTKVVHADGSTLDIRDLVSELKELSPELLERAQKEFMGGFASAANDLIVYRKLEEMGASDSIKDLSVDQLKLLVHQYRHVISDAFELDDYFNELQFQEDIDVKLNELYQNYKFRLPKLNYLDILFLGESLFADSNEHLYYQNIVVRALIQQEVVIENALTLLGFKEAAKRQELDEAIFYAYLLASKCPDEEEYFNEYQLLVDISNRIDLFTLMYKNFIDCDSIAEAFCNYGHGNHTGGIDTVSGVNEYEEVEDFDDNDVFYDIDPIHFAYMEPILATIIADKDCFDRLKGLIERTRLAFNYELNKKLCGNFTAECDFISPLLSYLYGRRAAFIGEAAVVDAIGKINGDDTRTLFIYDIFMNEEFIAGSNVNEYQQAVKQFKDVIEEAVKKDQITDDMKEWAVHIYHNTLIFNRLCTTIPSIVTAGDGTLTTLNYDNERVFVEMLFFYSKFLVNQMRKSIVYNAQGEQIDRDSLEYIKALAARNEARRKGEHYEGDEFEQKFLVGDNGFIPVIPGTPALSAFLIGRAFTYGEFLAVQNPDFAFTVLKYADFVGSYMASAYLANFYQSHYDGFLSSRGQLLVQQHVRAVISYQLGELCSSPQFSYLRLFRNKKQYSDGALRSKFYQSLEGKDEKLDYIFSLNPTLDDHDRDEGIQPLSVSAYGSILGNSVIALNDLLIEQTSLIDRYAKTLEMLLRLTELQLKTEYSPVCCFAMYRFLSSDHVYGNTATVRMFERYNDNAVLGVLLERQLMPKSLISDDSESLIGPSFPKSDIAVMFLQIGMFYSDYREQGYALINAQLDSLRGNIAPMCMPYADELFRTSAALQNGNALSYMSKVETALGHVSKGDLYAIAATHQATARTYKDTVHYLVRNDLKADREAFAMQMVFLNRPYGYYESYLTLKDDESRRAEAHTYLFYAARMSVPEAMADLEALEKAELFKPLPFVLYLRYLEELSKTNLQALLILFLFSQNGDLLPPNQFFFIELLEKHHKIFSNSALKQIMLERGFINTSFARRRIDHQTTWYGMFGIEPDILRKGNDEVNGNSSRINGLIEMLELLDLNYLYHSITDLRVQDVIRKLFDRLSEGNTDIERRILFNWSCSEFFPSYLREYGEPNLRRLGVIDSVHNHCGIDFIMSMYSHVLDACYSGVSSVLSLNTLKKNSHPLIEASNISNTFNNIVQGGFAHVSINTMMAFAHNAIRGIGRPNLGLFVRFNRFLANQGIGAAERLSRLDYNYINDYPYGYVFDKQMLEAKNHDIDVMSKITASEPINNKIIQTMVEKFHQVTLIRKFLANHPNDESNASGEDDASIILQYGDETNGHASDGANASASANGSLGKKAKGKSRRTSRKDAVVSEISVQDPEVANDAITTDSDDLDVVLDKSQSDKSQTSDSASATLLDQANLSGAVKLSSLLTPEHDGHIKSLAKELSKYCTQSLQKTAERILNNSYGICRVECTVMQSMLREWVDPFVWEKQILDCWTQTRVNLDQDEVAELLSEFESGIEQHTEEKDLEIFLKHFIDLEFFRRSQGINLIQTIVFSRNGWQLSRKANGPKRSYTYLLAKDLLAGIHGAVERFNYYVQSHRFSYIVNGDYFFSNEHLDTARKFVNDVLQLDINSDKFHDFAQSMVTEGFHEFEQLIREDENGYVKGSYRYYDQHTDLDPLTGMATHPYHGQHPLMNFAPQDLLRARNELKLWAKTLDNLSKESVEEREKFFLTSDYETLQASGDDGLILRNDIERILGPDNIDRLVYGSNQQWINYTFYDRPGVNKRDMINMLPKSCCILPYRLIQEFGAEDRALILNKSFKAVNHSDNKDLFLKNLYRAEADNINGSEIWGISYDERSSRWNASKDQLILQISREYTIYSQELHDLRVFSSAYSDAQYRYDTMALQLAKTRKYAQDRASSIDASSLATDAITQSLGLKSSTSSDGALRSSSDRGAFSIDSDYGASISDVDSASAALLNESSGAKGYSAEEEALWSSLSHGEEYTGDLFVKPANITAETILDRVRLIAAAAGSRMAASTNYSAEPSYENSSVDITTAVPAVDIGAVTSGGSASGMSDSATTIAQGAISSAANAADTTDSSAARDTQREAVKLNLAKAAASEASGTDGDAQGSGAQSSESSEQSKADAFTSSMASMAGELKDILTNNHADNSLFNSLKDFLSNKLSSGGITQDQIDPLAASLVKASQGRLGDRDEFMQLFSVGSKKAEQGVDYLRDELDNKSSLLSHVFDSSWEFDEKLDAQYTRPAMFHEDENPLHVLLYLMVNVNTADNRYEAKLIYENDFMYKLRRLGYFYGASDIVDSSMPVIAIESYHTRYYRQDFYNDFSSAVTEQAKSIGLKALDYGELQHLVEVDESTVDKVTKKLSKFAKMPSYTTKGQLFEVMINNADDVQTIRSPHYQTLLCTTKKQLRAGKIPYLCDDSILNPAMIDLFACRELITRCPNLIRLFSAYGYSSGDAKDIAPDANSYKPENRYLSKLRDIVNRVDRKADEPDYVGMDSRGFLYYDDIKVIEEYERNHKLPQSSIAYAPLDEQNKIRTLCDEEYAASISIIDSDESSYATDEQAAFHRACGKTHDLRTYTNLYNDMGKEVRFADLSENVKQLFAPVSAKLLSMQQCMYIFHATDDDYAHPFVIEYLDSGFGLSYRKIWTNTTLEEIGASYNYMVKNYEYVPRLTGALAEYRDTVVLEQKDVERFRAFFRKNSFIPVDTTKKMVKRYLHAGIYDFDLMTANIRESGASSESDGYTTEDRTEQEDFYVASGLNIKTTDHVGDGDIFSVSPHKKSSSTQEKLKDDAITNSESSIGTDTTVDSQSTAKSTSLSGKTIRSAADGNTYVKGAYGEEDDSETASQDSHKESSSHRKHHARVKDHNADSDVREAQDENLAQQTGFTRSNDALNVHNEPMDEDLWSRSKDFSPSREQLERCRLNYIRYLENLSGDSTGDQEQVALSHAHEYEQLVKAFYASDEVHSSSGDDDDGNSSHGDDDDGNSNHGDNDSTHYDGSFIDQLLSRYESYDDDEEEDQEDPDTSLSDDVALPISPGGGDNDILLISDDDIDEFIDFLNYNDLDPTDIASMAEMIASAYIQHMRNLGATDDEIIDKVFDKNGNFDVHVAFEELKNQSSNPDYKDAVYTDVDDDDDDDDDEAAASKTTKSKAKSKSQQKSKHQTKK